MSNKIRIKKSSVAAKVPLVADLDYGELAINYADGLLYYKKSDATIQSISSGGIETLATVTGRGATTTVAISTGAITSSGNILVGATSVFNFNGNAWGVDKIIFRTDVLQKILTDGSGNFDWLTAGKNWTLSDVGNVGVGTTTMVGKFNVYATSENVALFQSTVTQALVRIRDSTTTLDPYIGSYGNAMAFGKYGGGETMRIDANGNLGIGVTAPEATLHILKTGGSTTAPNTALILDYESDTASLAGGGTAIEFRGKSGSGNVANYPQARIRSVAYAGNNSHGIALDYRNSFASGLLEGMRITESGSVGIGVSAINPNTRLHIANPIDTISLIDATTLTEGNRAAVFMAARNVNGNSGNVSIEAISVNNQQNEMVFRTGSTVLNGFGTERMRITSAGYVGIGATNPSRKLHVNGPGVQFSNTDGEHSLLIGDQNYAYWNLYTPASPTYLSFQWNSAEKMKIDNAGGLTLAGSVTATRHIATTSTAVDAAGVFGYNSVQGTYIFSNAGSGRVFSLYNGSGGEQYTIGTDYTHIWYTNTAQRMALTATGLGVGASSPAAKLDVSGNQVINIVAVPILNVDCSLGNYFTITIAGTSTLTFSNPPASRAYAFTLEVTHTSGSITWPATVQWPSATAPTLTTGKTHLFVFVTDDAGTRWRGVSSVDYTN